MKCGFLSVVTLCAEVLKTPRSFLQIHKLRKGNRSEVNLDPLSFTVYSTSLLLFFEEIFLITIRWREKLETCRNMIPQMGQESHLFEHDFRTQEFDRTIQLYESSMYLRVWMIHVKGLTQWPFVVFTRRDTRTLCHCHVSWQRGPRWVQSGGRPEGWQVYKLDTISLCLHPNGNSRSHSGIWEWSHRLNVNRRFGRPDVRL